MHMRTQQSNKTGECMSLTLVRRSTRLGLLPSVVCFEKRNKPSVVLGKKGKRKKEKRKERKEGWTGCRGPGLRGVRGDFQQCTDMKSLPWTPELLLDMQIIKS